MTDEGERRSLGINFRLFIGTDKPPIKSGEAFTTGAFNGRDTGVTHFLGLEDVVGASNGRETCGLLFIGLVDASNASKEARVPFFGLEDIVGASKG